MKTKVRKPLTVAQRQRLYAAQRRYRARNPEMVRAYARKYRNAHPDQRIAERKAYYNRSAPGEAREWTQAEMERITSDGRPSDEVLSYELRRSKRAIQIMRCRLRKGGR